MPGPRTLIIAACLTASVVVSACAGGTQNSASLTAPTAQTTIATAPLSVQVGVTNPGEPGVSRLVAVGEHQLSAISQRGTQWGPFRTTVTADGRVERLGCMPANGL